jgi:GntR family transcriptional regulator
MLLPSHFCFFHGVFCDELREQPLNISWIECSKSFILIMRLGVQLVKAGINTSIDNLLVAPQNGRMPTKTRPTAGVLSGDASAHLWEQVAALIESEVKNCAPGSRLPSEAERSQLLGVSRVTLRQALSRLQERGLIESKAGRGWFVSDGTTPRATRTTGRPIFEPPGKLMSFSEMARLKGSIPDSVVLEQQTRPATFEEAEVLAVMPGAHVFVLRRVRRLNGVAIAIDHSVVPLYVLPNAMTIDFQRASLHAAFNAADATLAAAETEVEAILADSEMAELLDVKPGFPLLKVRQAFFDSRGRAVEKGVIIYRSDRYRFRSRLRA